LLAHRLGYVRAWLSELRRGAFQTHVCPLVRDQERLTLRTRTFLFLAEPAQHGCRRNSSFGRDDAKAVRGIPFVCRDSRSPQLLDWLRLKERLGWDAKCFGEGSLLGGGGPPRPLRDLGQTRPPDVASPGELCDAEPELEPTRVQEGRRVSVAAPGRASLNFGTGGSDAAPASTLCRLVACARRPLVVSAREARIRSGVTAALARGRFPEQGGGARLERGREPLRDVDGRLPLTAIDLAELAIAP